MPMPEFKRLRQLFHSRVTGSYNKTLFYFIILFFSSFYFITLSFYFITLNILSRSHIYCYHESFNHIVLYINKACDTRVPESQLDTSPCFSIHQLSICHDDTSDIYNVL